MYELGVYVYMYTCMYVYTCRYVYMCVYVCIYIYRERERDVA